VGENTAVMRLFRTFTLVNGFGASQTRKMVVVDPPLIENPWVTEKGTMM
jgi:hypothetical protein